MLDKDPSVVQIGAHVHAGDEHQGVGQAWIGQLGDQYAQLLLQKLGNALLSTTGHGNKDSDKGRRPQDEACAGAPRPVSTSRGAILQPSSCKALIGLSTNSFFLVRLEDVACLVVIEVAEGDAALVAGL